MSDCSSCVSKCRGVKTVDCPFYEEDKFKGVREALKNLQGAIYGAPGISATELEHARPYGRSLVADLAHLIDFPEGIVPDSIYNAMYHGTTATNCFSTGTTNNSAWTVVQTDSPPEEIPLVGPLEVLRSNPD